MLAGSREKEGVCFVMQKMVIIRKKQEITETKGHHQTTAMATTIFNKPSGEPGTTWSTMVSNTWYGTWGISCNNKIRGKIAGSISKWTNEKKTRRIWTGASIEGKWKLWISVVAGGSIVRDPLDSLVFLIFLENFFYSKRKTNITTTVLSFRFNIYIRQELAGCSWKETRTCKQDYPKY